MKKQPASLVWSLCLPLAVTLAGSCNGGVIGGTNGGDGGTDDGGTSGGAPTIPGCVGACTVNYSCPDAMGPTTLTGTVNIPSGSLPVNNAQVYIPTGDVIPDPPQSGVSCDRCVAAPSMFYTTTDVNGHFTLKNIPSGQNIPLIVKVGKWRRVVTIPNVPECASTPLATDLTRLPKNQTEGNIPKIALSTGNLDALECVLREKKLGLDDSEFTTEAGNGRVNLYAGVGTGADQYAANNQYNVGHLTFTKSNPWWDTAANWQKYDIVMLSCEGEAVAYDLTQKSVAARQNMQTYLNLGGRIFASHWHNVWLQKAVALPAPSTEPLLSTVASFVAPSNGKLDYSNDSTTPDEATINTSFPKGLALQQWLQGNAALNTNGTLPISFTRVTLSTKNINVTPAGNNPNPALTSSWLNLTKTVTALNTDLANPPSQYFSFYAPLSQPPALQCGQMVFTDLHVAGGPTGDKSVSGAATAFPSGCTTMGLTPQEKALIFLLFDLTSCVAPVIG